MAGAILFAVPVGVAAAIGFGTSLSGVAGGLSAIAEGPDTITTSTAATPAKLNRAVATLANRSALSRADGAPGRTGLPVGTDVGGTDDGSAGLDGTGGGGGGTGTTDPTGTIDPPRIDLPGGDGGGGGGGGGGDGGNTVNGVEDTVNGVIDGVGNTVNGVLGG